MLDKIRQLLPLCQLKTELHVNLTQKWDVVMEFAEMNYYKCKTEDEENAAFLDLASGGATRCAGLLPGRRSSTILQ